MSASGKTLIVLGGGGFIGQRVVRDAVQSGWAVKALTRSDVSARLAAEAGALVLRSDAVKSAQWLNELEGASAIIDLVQPAVPSRLGRRQVEVISAERHIFTKALVQTLRSQPADQRPILVSVSGIDDLAPDPNGYLSANSPLTTKDSGFNPIGIPVRRLIEQSGIKASFVYFGTIYGPGGVFGDAIFPALAAGKWKNFGGRADRMVLTHVDDAARGLITIAGLGASQIAGKSYVITDADPVDMAAFFGLAAQLMGVASPGRVPKWMASLVAGQSLIEATLHKTP